jgi:hypothetical protein
MKNPCKPIGLGCNNYQLAVSIGNRPELPEYQSMTGIHPVSSGEITNIGLQCGNGWRKVFNVYAKLVFGLADQQFNRVEQCTSWQEYRDAKLLQAASRTALIFGAPSSTTIKSAHKSVEIICGKTHANNLIDNQLIDSQFEWLDSEFAINRHSRCIVCPYFDYRQLSNIKIERLIGLIRSF